MIFDYHFDILLLCLTFPTSLVFGECLYRVILMLKHAMNSSKKRPLQNRRPTRRPKKGSIFAKFFGTKFGTIVVAVMASVAFILVMGVSKHLLAWLAGVVFWAVSRLHNAEQFLCNYDREQLREDAPQESGKGMAWSYWCGLLKILFAKNEETVSFTKALKKFEDDKGISLADENFIMLIPRSCNIPDNITSERIKVYGELEVEVSDEMRGAINERSRKLRVHKVISEHDRNQIHYAVFECPNILKSVLGGQDNDIEQSLKDRNVDVFKRYLKNHIFARDSSPTNQLPYSFLDYDDLEWQEKGISDTEYSLKLADVIIEHLEKDRQDLMEVISSDED